MDEERRYLLVRQGAMVGRFLVPRAKLLLDPDAGRHLLPIAAQDCGLESSLHALQYPSCRLGLRKPDRGQRVEDLLSFDLSNLPITMLGKT